MSKIFCFLIIVLFLGFNFLGFGQNGNNLGGPFTFNIPCGSNCTNLNFKIPVVKSTEDYTQKSIPFQPVFPWVTPTGNEVTSVYVDDKYSVALDLPFSFCMYGQTFDKFIVGSNGVVAFDLTLANCSNAYTVPNNIPFEGTGSCSSITGPRYPKFSIMSPYHDIDPSVTNTAPNRKIEWRIDGVAPKRKLVVSFYRIAMFSCTSLIASSQIIVNERSGTIEVFIENKPTCSSWQSGRAILGIQKDATLGLPVPGHNATDPAWSEANTGYRFTPSGATNLLQGVTITKKNGAVVGVGTLGTTANDSTEITYSNYCLTGAGPDTLVVNANYKSCTGLVADDYTLVDTIYVIKSPADLLATATTVPATCLAADGSITVNVPANAGTAPFQYSINGGALQNSNTFTGLASATYTIFVKDASGACTSTLTVNVGLINPVTGIAVGLPPSCAGASNGTLTVTATNATAPITYSLNGGTPQSSNVFTGLAAGTYNITISDGKGCNRSVFGTVPAGSGSLAATVTPTATSCAGASNGSITVTNPEGLAPHQYAIGAAGVFGPSNTFSGLAAGTYIIRFRDANGCTGTYNIIVANGAGLIATLTPTATSCPGAANGSIAVTNPSGSAPHEYALGAAGVFGSSSVFTNLVNGSYVIRVKDVNGCISSFNVSIAPGPGITATTSAVATSCTGVNNGSITVTASNGATPYQYSLNGGANQGSNIFTGLAAGNYSITVTDANSCNVTINTTTVATGTGFTATSVVVPTTCAGVNNGTITVTPTGGTAPYSYVLDGGTSQGSNIFTGVSAGNHVVLITDGVGCTRTLNISVATGTGINATFTTTPTSCSAINNGSITITPSNGTAPYNYSLNGATAQSSNVFSNLSSGNYTVLVTDGLGCTRTLNISVTAGTVFTLSQVNTLATCAFATNGTVTVSVTGGSAPFQYALDGGANQSLNTFTNLSVGSHTVLVTDGAGCTNSITFSIIAGSGITAIATPTATSCNGASNGQIVINANNGSTPYQYQLGAAPFQLSNTFNGLLAGNYTITIKDANGCTTTVNTTIAQGANLTATTSVINPSCNGNNNGQVTITNTNGNAPYQYNLNGGAFQNTNIFSGLSVGTYTIGLIDGNNCTGTVTVNITAPNSLSATVVSTPVICNGQTNGLLTVTVTGGTPGASGYQYSINNGTTFQSSNIFNVGAGLYTVLVRDSNGCTVTTSTTVTQPNALSVTATATNASCNGGADGSITANGIGGVATLTYSIDGTTFQSNPLFNVVAGNYTVTVKDANNCTNTTNAVVALSSNILVNARIDTTICESKSVTLTTVSNATSFRWYPGITLNDSLIQNPIATPLVTTKYYVIGTLGNCTGIDSVTVTVNPAPIANAGSDFSICFGQTQVLQGSGGTQFVWAPSATLNNPNTSNPIASPTVTTKYWLKVTDANSCTSINTDTMEVTVTPPLQAYAGPDTTIVMGQPYQLNAVLVGQPNATNLTYLWQPSFGLSNATIQNPIATITGNQIYNVEIITAAGCKGTGVVRLDVLRGPDIYVPTSFTPNGDGLNDLFRTFPVGIKQFDYLRVFNRWGQLVFESKIPSKGWDGKLKNLDQPTGAYIFNVQGITEAGKVINKKGTLLIVR